MAGRPCGRAVGALSGAPRPAQPRRRPPASPPPDSYLCGCRYGAGHVYGCLNPGHRAAGRRAPPPIPLAERGSTPPQLPAAPGAAARMMGTAAVRSPHHGSGAGASLAQPPTVAVALGPKLLGVGGTGPFPGAPAAPPPPSWRTGDASESSELTGGARWPGSALPVARWATSTGAHQGSTAALLLRSPSWDPAHAQGTTVPRHRRHRRGRFSTASRGVVEPRAHRGEAGALPLAPRVLGAYRAQQ